jgi:hypothetical protein
MDSSMAENRHTITGYAFLINSGAIFLSSKCQEIVSLSIIESKYMAATYSIKEVLWLHSLLSKVFNSITIPTILFSNN